jgi:hypothetical protein
LGLFSGQPDAGRDGQQIGAQGIELTVELGPRGRRDRASAGWSPDEF